MSPERGTEQVLFSQQSSLKGTAQKSLRGSFTQNLNQFQKWYRIRRSIQQKLLVSSGI
jgi:hypothetical protein